MTDQAALLAETEAPAEAMDLAALRVEETEAPTRYPAPACTCCSITYTLLYPKWGDKNKESNNKYLIFYSILQHLVVLHTHFMREGCKPH